MAHNNELKDLLIGLCVWEPGFYWIGKNYYAKELILMNL